MPHTKNAKDQWENPTEKKDHPTDFTNTAKDFANTAKDMTKAAVDKVDSAVGTVGENISGFADTVRDKGPKEGILGSATKTVASGIERTGDYLDEKGVSGMANDVMSLCRSYPIATLLVGVGIGFLLARASSRS